MTGHQVVIVGIACALASCEGNPVSRADIIGEYRGNIPPGLATLIINADSTWEYRIDGPKYFTRSGKWVPEPDITTSSEYVITFDRFEFGFPLNDFTGMPPLIKKEAESAQLKPSIWFAYFEKDSAGKVSTCMRDRKYCFKHL